MPVKFGAITNHSAYTAVSPCSSLSDAKGAERDGCMHRPWCNKIKMFSRQISTHSRIYPKILQYKWENTLESQLTQ